MMLGATLEEISSKKNEKKLPAPTLTFTARDELPMMLLCVSP